MIALALTYWKPLAIVAAFLALFGWHKIEVAKSYRAGAAAEQAKARIEAGKRIVEMEQANEQFRKLPALDRCRLFMRDSGLPEHNCD